MGLRGASVECTKGAVSR